MTFEEEWAGLRAEAQSRMRLNGAPGPVGAPDLKSSAAKKKAAVSALEQHVEPDTQAAGKLMDETSEAAAKGFNGWATGAGITEALKGWRASVKSLQSRLAAEKTALSQTHHLLTGADLQLGGQFSLLKPLPVSPQSTEH
ncbi:MULTISPECIES: hypothetical protein [Streptomyces]|uniref:ABC transporter permease n=1 Tax=Streptomyces luteosporeus TaxID=173856 RepID=A0ABN3U7V9_9ACTN